jgi:hypothetical protein
MHLFSKKNVSCRVKRDIWHLRVDIARTRPGSSPPQADRNDTILLNLIDK